MPRRHVGDPVLVAVPHAVHGDEVGHREVDQVRVEPLDLVGGQEVGRGFLEVLLNLGLVEEGDLVGQVGEGFGVNLDLRLRITLFILSVWVGLNFCVCIFFFYVHFTNSFLIDNIIFNLFFIFYLLLFELLFVFFFNLFLFSLILLFVFLN